MRPHPHLALAPLLAVFACQPDPPPQEAAEPVQKAPLVQCPTTEFEDEVAPGVRPEYRKAEYWLDRAANNDRVILSREAIRELNAKTRDVQGAHTDLGDPALADMALVEKEWNERLDWLQAKVDSGEYVEGTPGAMDSARQAMTKTESTDELRLVVTESPLWCIPTLDGLHTPPVKRKFDRNRCASLHPGEAVRVLGKAGDWTYVRATHSVGWLRVPTLSPPLSVEEFRAFVEPEQVAVVITDRIQVGADVRLRSGMAFPTRDIEGKPHVAVATSAGIEERPLPVRGGLRPGYRPFTRRELFTAALEGLDQPYGWGGHSGNRDCSRYLHDLFAQFGIQTARHSAVQAKLGTQSVDVSTLDEAAKRAKIRELAAEGVVVLFMPGHIMLYLGEADGHDWGVSSLSEFVVPCPGGEDTIHRLDKVAITDLEMGRGSKRRAFIERISRLSVYR